jgi:hypothetical protein
MRFTRTDAEGAFQRLAEALHKPTDCWIEGGKARVGAWRLDYNPTYGGAVIEEMMNEGGGVRRPLGDYRMSPREFYYAVRMSLDALRKSHA